MLLNIEKSVEQDQKCTKERLVNTDPVRLTHYQTTNFKTLPN